MLRRHHPSFTPPARSRRGFTLVELLVACGLVVLILTILAVAFGAATESLGRLKGTGDMATNLRVATDRLKADLNAPHFEGGDSPDGMRLSDLRFDLGGTPPPAGYFRIEQGSASTYEGRDSDGFASTRATNHAIEFTTKREGRSADDLFAVAAAAGLSQYSAADVTGGVNSKWARVRWELRPNPQLKNGVQTFTLYRSVRAVLPPAAAGVNVAADVAVIAARADATVATLADLSVPPEAFATNPNARTALAPAGTGSATYGDDIVLTDVLSFEVKATWEGGTPPRTNLPVAGNPLNMDYPYDDLPPATNNTAFSLLNQRVFDTWSSQVAGWQTAGTAASVPNRIRVTGVMVKVRVFDPKHNLARQVTFQIQQ